MKTLLLSFAIASLFCGSISRADQSREGDASNRGRMWRCEVDGYRRYFGFAYERYEAIHRAERKCQEEDTSPNPGVPDHQACLFQGCDRI